MQQQSLTMELWSSTRTCKKAHEEIQNQHLARQIIINYSIQTMYVGYYITKFDTNYQEKLILTEHKECWVKMQCVLVTGHHVILQTQGQFLRHDPLPRSLCLILATRAKVHNVLQNLFVVSCERLLPWQHQDLNRQCYNINITKDSNIKLKTDK